MILAILLTVSMVSTDSTEFYHAQNDARRLSEWCAGFRPAESVAQRDAELQCRYRLFPLTRDESVIRDLPTKLEPETARGLALLSGLWGFRASTAGMVNAVRYGMRAQKLLERAMELAPEDPFVLLVDAHSLIFKPGIAGGDRRLAAERFERLASKLAAMDEPIIYPDEARTWRWVALSKEKDPRAEPLRIELLQRDMPPLFTLMLNSDT